MRFSSSFRFVREMHVFGHAPGNAGTWRLRRATPWSGPYAGLQAQPSPQSVVFALQEDDTGCRGAGVLPVGMTQGVVFTREARGTRRGCSGLGTGASRPDGSADGKEGGRAAQVSDDALVAQQGDGLHLGMHAQLGVDVGQMLLHRVARDEQPLRRFGGGGPGGNAAHDVHLALG